MISELFMQSLPAGFGAFVGVLVGLYWRKKRGKAERLLGGSIILTSAAIAAFALVVTMVGTYFFGGAS